MKVICSAWTKVLSTCDYLPTSSKPRQSPTQIVFSNCYQRSFNFYSAPRFVTHIDDGAIASLTSYYRDNLQPNGDVLDLCSSWVSHLPNDLPLGRVVGLGMNARELEANERLTEFVQVDLNVSPKLPFDDNSFDACLNVVSVDYLCRPKEVFEEMHRVLRPGGQAISALPCPCA